MSINSDIESFVLDDIAPYEDEDDGREHLTHIINPPMNLHIWQDGMTVEEIVDIAGMGGIQIKALCGFVFIPKRNPDKYDMCSACIDIAGHIMIELGE